jgi:hypothetical protein
VKLDVDDIEAVAARVVELLLEQTALAGRYVDAAALARALGVDRDWVYSRARELGAVRLGDGPKARLRFDLARVERLLRDSGTAPQAPKPRPIRARNQRGQTVELIPFDP